MRVSTERVSLEISCDPSGAGTNLKVGGTGPERKWGHRSGAKRRKKNFSLAPPLFGSKSTISRFVERSRDGQYSLASFLFAVLLLTVPPVPSHFKSGGTCPRAPWSQRHCVTLCIRHSTQSDCLSSRWYAGQAAELCFGVLATEKADRYACATCLRCKRLSFWSYCNQIVENRDETLFRSVVTTANTSFAELNKNWTYDKIDWKQEKEKKNWNKSNFRYLHLNDGLEMEFTAC